MWDFLNDIREVITKKFVIVFLIIISLIIAGIISIVMISNSKNTNPAQLEVVEETDPPEVYTLEIESSDKVSAESIYQKLVSTNSELKLLSMESDQSPQIVLLSSDAVIDSSVEVCYANGAYNKSFLTAGEYDETLIVHNQADQSISSLAVKLIVTEAKVTTDITTETTADSTVTSRTSKTTVSSIGTSTTAVLNDYTYDNDEDEEEYDEYYEDDYDYYEEDDDYYYNESYYAYSASNYSNQSANANSDVELTNKEPEQVNSEIGITEPAAEEPTDEETSYEKAEDFGWTGIQAEWFNYAMSQGCNVWQASAYANACSNYGSENIFIGLTPEDSTCWGVWYYDEETDMYRAA